MSDILTTNYGSLTGGIIDFGTVNVGTPADITIALRSEDGPPPRGPGFPITCSPSTVTGAAFSLVSDIAPNPVLGTSDSHMVIRFTPSILGAVTGTLTLTFGAGNNPLVFTLKGTGGAAAVLTLTPQTTNDFGNVKDGTTSAPLNVLAINNSGTDITVTVIAFNGDFSAAPGQPGLPFTLHANNADGPTTIPVQFIPSLTGFRITANAVVVTSGATNSPTDQAMQGTGVIILPAFTTLIDPQAVLMAFVLGSVSTVLEMDSTDLDTEEPASFDRVYDWGMPLFEKYLGRVILRYEDESAVQFAYTVTGVAPRIPSPVSVPVTTQGGANDGLVHNSFADLQISDDLIQVEVSRDANAGPMVITEIFHEVDKRGEVIEAA